MLQLSYRLGCGPWESMKIRDFVGSGFANAEGAPASRRRRQSARFQALEFPPRLGMLSWIGILLLTAADYARRAACERVCELRCDRRWAFETTNRPGQYPPNPYGDEGRMASCLTTCARLRNCYE